MKMMATMKVHAPWYTQFTVLESVRWMCTAAPTFDISILPEVDVDTMLMPEPLDLCGEG